MVSKAGRKIWNGGDCKVPEAVAVCPECLSDVHVHCIEWDAETGRPTACGLDIACVRDADDGGDTVHRYYQSEWQPIRDAVARWCEASSF